MSPMLKGLRERTYRGYYATKAIEPGQEVRYEFANAQPGHDFVWLALAIRLIGYPRDEELFHLDWMMARMFITPQVERKEFDPDDGLGQWLQVEKGYNDLPGSMCPSRERIPSRTASASSWRTRRPTTTSPSPRRACSSWDFSLATWSRSVSNPNRIQGEWESFRDAVGLAEAPDVQQVECRRAFFAGVQALMGVMFSALDHGNPDDATKADLEVMDHVADELKQFQLDLMRGRA